MKIYKARDFLEAYKVRASSADINDLSGRDGLPQLTSYVSSSLATELSLRPGDTLVDVGCGEGSLLRMLVEQGIPASCLRGVLPSEEEVNRVASHLGSFGCHPVITKGKADCTGLPDQWASHTVCNAVLLLLKGPEEAMEALKELIRITRQGGTILVGELPDVDERTLDIQREASPLEASAFQRAAAVLACYGPLELWRRFCLRVGAIFDNRLVVMTPPTTYFERPDVFEKRALELGLTLYRRYNSPSLSRQGCPIALEHRWNYLFHRP